VIKNPDPPSVSCRVGARIGFWWHTTYPFGRLTATREQIRIHAGFGRTAIDRARVESVIRRRFLKRNVITFRTDDASATWVFVFAPRTGKILDALEALDWPVEDRA
jgi:hypothetical protein